MLLSKVNVLLLCMVLSGISCLDESDPSGCSDRYPKCTQGRNQSPIDIREEDVVAKDLGSIVFENYNTTSLGMRVTNYGEYILAVVDITHGKAYISGSGLADDKYQLAQFHFHWGSDSTKGSEHKYEGRAYPAELHFVHYNCKYSSLLEAVDKEPDGVAALVVFIEIGEKDNPAFTEVFNGINSVRKAGSKQVIKPVQLDTLLPKDTESFYRYQGSLSTPEFHESVQWTLLKTPIQLSEKQLTQLRQLRNHKRRSGLNTFRPTQPLYERTVYYNSGRKSGSLREEF